MPNVGETGKDNEFLWNQLIKLGDMMGDGLHLEPDGKWIEKEYKNICKLLGLVPKSTRTTHSKQINEFMTERLKVVKCDCGNELKQTRKGSFIAKCIICKKKYRLGKAKRK